ncbi:alpha/beta fold hydrolase [Actinospica robiniae]|uniref:alpha/beta fold hydrolase n=1 Tax=Actinospica robiniae TaxID=304901 RepID=UPI0003F96D61|nr:alpha/beta hydrolase [Actinospica robiniae]
MSEQTVTETVTAVDGTEIVIDVVGEGDAVVLIGGAFNDRSTVAGLAEQLASRFSVFTYDRRGRGASGDESQDYAIADEVGDLATVLGYAGGRASVFGHSSGAILALEGAHHGLPIDRLAVYEPPYSADPDLPRPAPELFGRLKALVAAGDRDGAAQLFLRDLVGVPEQGVAGMKSGPAWSFLVDKAPSLPYDALLSSPWDLLSSDRLTGIDLPVLAIYGEQTTPGLAAGTKAVAALVPGAALEVVPDEDHSVLQRPAVLAPLLTTFFG